MHCILTSIFAFLKYSPHNSSYLGTERGIFSTIMKRREIMRLNEISLEFFAAV